MFSLMSIYHFDSHPVYQELHIVLHSLGLQRCSKMWSWGDGKPVCPVLVVL